MKIQMIVALALLAATPAAAQVTGAAGNNGGNIETGQSSAPDSSSGAEDRNEAGERRICRRVETQSSSRNAYRRICLTAREWRQRQ